MIIQHSAVTSDVFKLIETLEFDMEIKGHFLPTRIELFQDTERSNRFRCRMWERELYHMRLTMTDKNEPESNFESDEEVLVERTWELSSEFEDFEAETPEAAMRRFLDSLEKYLERITGAK